VDKWGEENRNGNGNGRWNALTSSRCPNHRLQTRVKNENQKLYYHRVGESQDQDTLIAEFHEHPSWMLQI